ncbi:RidA family protein [Micrococcus sp. TA1]|uniref:RidA family protein n=1 Tax=Micrococcus sp. TA1 TaxID=681627 RepID=UPI00161DC2A6|nr:RidA family protein [Micrococcus sp. TA1]MBB5749509.1 enamine deaminase RidA (YjgF/YER057c/UK114 family) [Micrococcus sp. TA1]
MLNPSPAQKLHTVNGVRDRLRESGIRLPRATAPNYSYVAVQTWGELAFVSGQIPKDDGRLAYEGRVGEDRTLDEAVAAAELCAANALAQLDSAVGLKRIARVVKLNGYVASTEDFMEHPSVIEGASQFLGTALGERGRHARTALGVSRLPANALVEIELVVGLHPAEGTPSTQDRHP